MLLARMEIGELGPGLYKIIKRNEISHSRYVHLLRVTGYGEGKKYFLDNDSQGEHPHAFEFSEWYEYRVVKKYNDAPMIHKPSLSIRFTDEDGHEYTFTARDAWTLRGTFELLPWLKKAFGFMPNKSKEVKMDEGNMTSIGHHVRRKRGS